VSSKHRVNPPQQQSRQPGEQARMQPEPITIRDGYVGTGRLAGKVALITGGDSGIGRAVAVHFARESCDVAVAYLDEDVDARETKALVEANGRRCLLIRGDLRTPARCQAAVRRTLAEFDRLDVLVPNHAEQHPVEEPEQLTPAQIRKTFETNVFSYFYLVDAALPHMGDGACIVVTASVVAARGHDTLLDYAASKGAFQALTFSLAKALAERGIRVNAVAPGPIWTPLIPATFPRDKVAKFGSDVPLGRAGQPSEVAPSYVFLASDDASYITGQVLHPNGGEIVNG